MSTKPTILFVPGAWHKPTCYAPVISLLETHGYPVSTASLPSVGPIPGLSTWDSDISSIRSALSTLIEEQHKTVILAAHSYGSLPAGEALKNLTLSSRSAAGKKGGVAHFIYIAAFVLPPETSLMDALGGADLPWFSVSASKDNVDPINPEEVFYNDLTPEEQEQHVKELEPFSYQMFFQKTTWMPYKEVQCSYVFCTEDKALPVSVQRGMVQGTGAEWGEVVVEAGHSPFLSKPGEVVGWIEKIAGGLEG